MKSTDPSLLDQAPFSIYLGWISVAAIVNVTYYLTEIGFDGFGIPDTVWASLGLAAATILAFWFRTKENDFLYPLVIVWAFIGIGVKNMDEHSGYAYAAYALAVIIFLFDVFYRRKKVTA
ncbi:hypothetical protein [Rossellomorea marisflavi]|uniref:hypothetical protein n=1 Tax=Rossellomorea marisflavi TaxID=189381 RepID=UPI000A8C5841